MADAASSFAERVGRAIVANPHLTGRNLRFEAESGRVVLRGVVNTYFQKQMAQEALRYVDGVEQIDNQLQVSWLPDSSLHRAGEELPRELCSSELN